MQQETNEDKQEERKGRGSCFADVADVTTIRTVGVLSVSVPQRSVRRQKKPEIAVRFSRRWRRSGVSSLFSSVLLVFVS